jgi:hypothetical protein
VQGEPLRFPHENSSPPLADADVARVSRSREGVELVSPRVYSCRCAQTLLAHHPEQQSESVEHCRVRSRHEAFACRLVAPGARVDVVVDEQAATRETANSGAHMCISVLVQSNAYSQLSCTAIRAENCVDMLGAAAFGLGRASFGARLDIVLAVRAFLRLIVGPISPLRLRLVVAGWTYSSGLNGNFSRSIGKFSLAFGAP